MKCRSNVKRIEEICAELLNIIDDSRAHCESDECELIHCIVHDSVQNMRRVLARWNPEVPINPNADLIETGDEKGRSVN